MSKKKPNLAALLGDDSEDLERGITGTQSSKKAGGENTNSGSANQKPAIAQIKPAETTLGVQEEKDNEVETDRKDEIKMPLEEELGLPKPFTRVFRKNPRYEKAPKTTTIVYTDILSGYRALADKMDIDTVVILNNVLAEWYNKHIEVVDKVVNRKLAVRSL